MKSMGHLNFWMKGAQALLLAVAVCFAMGASDAGARFTDLGHRLMCTCGCAQLLGECNHVGCPESDRMRGELMAGVKGTGGGDGANGGGSGSPPGGMNDQQILNWFSNKYGVTVLAAPTTHGFNLVAWIAPFAVLLAATFGVVLLVRHWTVGKGAVATGPGGSAAITPEMAALRDKIRRETGADGGF
jgi:cytochrome c-type biogenesis protein CcmH